MTKNPKDKLWIRKSIDFKYRVCIMLPIHGVSEKVSDLVSDRQKVWYQKFLIFDGLSEFCFWMRFKRLERIFFVRNFAVWFIHKRSLRLRLEKRLRLSKAWKRAFVLRSACALFDMVKQQTAREGPGEEKKYAGAWLWQENSLTHVCVGARVHLFILKTTRNYETDSNSNQY